MICCRRNRSASSSASQSLQGQPLQHPLVREPRQADPPSQASRRGRLVWQGNLDRSLQTRPLVAEAGEEEDVSSSDPEFELVAVLGNYTPLTRRPRLPVNVRWKRLLQRYLRVRQLQAMFWCSGTALKAVSEQARTRTTRVFTNPRQRRAR